MRIIYITHIAHYKILYKQLGKIFTKCLNKHIKVLLNISCLLLIFVLVFSVQYFEVDAKEKMQGGGIVYSAE